MLALPRTNRILATALALGLLLVATGSAAAMPPTRDPIAAAAKGGGHGGGGGGGSTGGTTPHGYDISYPQCNAPYPKSPAFGIVGINGGRPYVAGNPCLASQLTWGGLDKAGLYVNTANPNPAQSSYWPNGRTAPRYCDPAANASADCSYDYGWYAGADSFSKAQAAYASLSIATSPSATPWWVDVETSNSWQSSVANNIAMLQGEVDYLRSVGVTQLGFYSTTAQWGTITGGTKVFSPMPVWGAGASSESGALSLCKSTTSSFTGGPLSMVQYIASGFDVDIRC